MVRDAAIGLATSRRWKRRLTGYGGSIEVSLANAVARFGWMFALHGRGRPCYEAATPSTELQGAKQEDGVSTFPDNRAMLAGREE